MSQWKRHLLVGASELFTRGKKRKGKEEGQAKEAELFQQIGRLEMELVRLKKISAALMPVNCASWSITKTLTSASAANARCWGCPSPRSITSPYRCGNQPCGSWPGSMLCIWKTHAVAAAGWLTTWPERDSRSVVIWSETSCAAWGYGRST